MNDTKFNYKNYNEYNNYLAMNGEDNKDTINRLLKNLSRAINEELTEKQRTAIEMYYMERRKMEDIAKILGVNVSTVSRNIMRGKKRLKRCLKYGAKELLESEFRMQ